MQTTKPPPPPVLTTVRTTVHVLLRGVLLTEGASYDVGGVKLIVMSRARAADWPEVDDLSKEDLETITWSTLAESSAVATALLQDEHVVSVRVEAAEGD